MELRRYLAILWRRKLLIGLAVVVAVVFTAVTTDTTKIYTSSSTIYVGATNYSLDANGNNGNLSGDETVGLAQVIRTFATMIMTPVIAEDAVEQTGVQRSPGTVANATKATQVPGTNLLRVEVSDTDPAIAQELATGMAQAFVAKIAEIDPAQPLGEGDVPRAPAQIFERARRATTPQSTSLVSNLFVAALFGLLLSSGLVLLAEYLDVTVKSPEDAEQRLDLPVLGAVPMLDLDPAATLRAIRRSGRDDLELLVRDA